LPGSGRSCYRREDAAMSSLTRLFLALILLNAALLFIPGRTDPRRGTDGKATLRVGLVFDVGGRGDKSFNDLAYEGVREAEERLGITAELVEPGDGADRESALRMLAAQGMDLVFGVGFIFTDDLNRVAPAFPRTLFAGVDYALHSEVPMPPNLVALKFREEEGAFLVGALAALTSRTGRVGFVGGMDMPLIHKFEAGYRAGVREVCPSCRVLVGYAGVTSQAFKDPGKGKELALAQYDAGADVIFHASGATGLGVFEAARLRQKLAIGVDADQWSEAPGRVLSSMVKLVNTAVYETIALLESGRFTPGVRVFGLKEKGVDYVYNEQNRPLIPQAVRARVEALRQEIIAGRIRVPTERPGHRGRGGRAP
jgi:basic membrane protein A